MLREHTLKFLTIYGTRLKDKSVRNTTTLSTNCPHALAVSAHETQSTDMMLQELPHKASATIVVLCVSLSLADVDPLTS